MLISLLLLLIPSWMYIVYRLIDDNMKAYEAKLIKEKSSKESYLELKFYRDRGKYLLRQIPDDAIIMDIEHSAERTRIGTMERSATIKVLWWENEED